MCQCLAQGRGDANHDRAGAVLDDHVGISRVARMGRVRRTLRTQGTARVGAAPFIHRPLAGGAEIRG
jgi:hypothetical protein